MMSNDQKTFENNENNLPKTSLVLRVCRSDMRTGYGIELPSRVGERVSAPNWNEDECEGGLNGWLYGHGYHTSVDYWNDHDAKWLVFEVPTSDIVALRGSCRFPSGILRFIGSKSDAADFIMANEPRSLNAGVIGASISVSDRKSVIVGSLGTATAGDYGTAVAGDHATATVGDYGTAVAGEYATATAGDHGTATAGYRGTATAGHRGTATARDYGTAKVGNQGVATAGYSGTAVSGKSGKSTAGTRGTAITGDYGTATAGKFGRATTGYGGIAVVGANGIATADYDGEIRITGWDDTAGKFRTIVGRVGENGILPNKPYKLNVNNEFVRAD